MVLELEILSRTWYWIYASSLVRGTNLMHDTDSITHHFDIKALLSGVIGAHFVHDSFVGPAVLSIDQAIPG